VRSATAGRAAIASSTSSASATPIASAPILFARNIST